VIQHEGGWHMLYTGVHMGEDGLIEQRVGLATSTDLTSWRKLPDNPLIEADPRYYSQRDPSTLGPERAWRDPCVLFSKYTRSSTQLPHCAE
jgi:beta-fructofuranosidase